MFFALALISVLSPNAQAGDACEAAMNAVKITYDCTSPNTKSIVQVQETGVSDGRIVANVAFRVSDRRTNKVLDSGGYAGVRRDCYEDPSDSDRNSRQYSFGDLGDGSLYSYTMSDDDGSQRKLWMNSLKVADKGFFSCTKR